MKTSVIITFLSMILGLVIPNAFGQVSYSIEDKAGLLDESFYERATYSDAFFPSLSNDGTKVAFYAMDRATQDSTSCRHGR